MATACGHHRGAWQARFGKDELDKVRKSLRELVNQFNVELPDYLPVASASKLDHEWHGRAGRERGDVAPLDLSALLSRVLLAFTIDFERESRLSLAISANALRVLTEEGVRGRDLPHLIGVSKEAISVSVRFLEWHGCPVVEPDPTATRTRLVRLTPKGQEAQDK